MRFVPIRYLIEGMTLGKTLFNSQGGIMLQKGTILNSRYLEKISLIGYNGVYIEDELSKEIEVKEIINENLRNKTVMNIKSFYQDTEKNNKFGQTRYLEVKKLIDDIIDDIIGNRKLMVNMVDLKVFDDYTFYHSVNVAVLSMILGVTLNFNRDNLYKLGLAGLFHDIGKAFISKEILHKPGKLSVEEFNIIKTHSKMGCDFIEEADICTAQTCTGVLQHHEKFDGTGYPHGLKGDKIALFARIITVADVYDALTSDRPYRPAVAPSEAMEFVMAGGGTNFDPEIASIFPRKVSPYPDGTGVVLSDGRVGLVAENYECYCMRPKLKIVRHGEELVEPYYINLKTDAETTSITIIGIVNL